MARRGEQFLFLLLGIGLALAGCAPTVSGDSTTRPPGVALSPSGQGAVPPSEGGFEKLSIADGLSQSTVTAILQDSQGFIWFGTRGGLNSYDGYQFTVFRHHPDDPGTLSNDSVNAIWEDKAGALWIGTDQGLDRLDRSTDTFVRFRHDPADATSLSAGAVLSVFEDDSEVLWVGTMSGLDCFDRAGGTFSHVLDGGPTRAIYQDQGGAIWIGANDGLRRFDSGDGNWTHFRHESGNPATLSDDRVRSIWQDRQGVLWIGTDGGGLNQLTPSAAAEDRIGGREAEDWTVAHHPLPASDSRQDLTGARVMAILEDTAGRLWIGTASGLDMLDESRRQWTHFAYDPASTSGLSDDLVLSLHEDRSGVLWIGTHGGLCKRNPAVGQFVLHRQDLEAAGGLSDNYVQTIYDEEDGTLWVGTFAGGLNRLDRGAGRTVVYRHDPADPASLSSDDVRALFVDRDGALWVGTDRGLDRFDPRTGGFTPVIGLSGVRVTAIAEDGATHLWIGTSAGLQRLDRVTTIARPLDPHGLRGIYLTALHRDRDGVLWAGTYGDGLHHWDPAEDRFVRLQTAAGESLGLRDEVVLSILEERGDSEGVVWVGTEKGGLGRYDRASRTFRYYTQEEGLPGDSVACILAAQDGTLWLGTNMGLAHFDPLSETFRNYDARDGLQGGEFLVGSCYQSERGEMFFGGIQGLNSFFPGRVWTNPRAPALVITAYDHFSPSTRRIMAPDEHLVLSHQENSISFEITALDFLAPEKNQYGYRMEGIDSDWIYAGTRRYVDYYDLAPGEYRFWARGSNSDGVWNNEGVAVRLTVRPAWWQTGWFRAAGVLLLLGAGLIAYRLRVRALEARGRALQTLVGERTAELSRVNAQLQAEMIERQRAEQALAEQAAEAAVSAERNRLARDMHDSVTQSVYSLTLLAEAGRRMIRARDLEQIAENQARMGTIARQALQELRLMVFELRPPPLRDEGLVGALEKRLEAVERRAGVEARLVDEGVGALGPPVEEALYHIAQEALNNALKHAAASAVAVALRMADGYVEMEVVDNGQGFEPSAAVGSGGLGLISIQERAAGAGGSCELTSAPGEGTRVRVRVSAGGENREAGS